MDDRNEAMVTEEIGHAVREMTPQERLEAELATKQKEIENVREEIVKLQKEQERLKKIKGYDEMSTDMKDIHNSLMAQGFTDDQAFQMLMQMIESVNKDSKSSLLRR